MGDRSFLALLAAEAPVAEFERCARELRRGGPETCAATDEVLAAALHVRDLLATRARRERELVALYETAGDLSSLRDLDRVLEAIVRRARELLASDAAYLTLIDTALGDTYMRVTEGIRTEEFNRVRLEMGAGLGGLVAQKVRPYATPDYLADTRFAHVHEVDAAVGGEDLVAILGVPLTLGRRVLGVLFAANRFERPFAPEEVALLSSLAAHAAIAIENARLFQEVQATLQELTAANEVISVHSAVVERTAALHERLSRLVLEGGGLADVALAINDVLGGYMVVVDGSDRVVAAAGEPIDGLAHESPIGGQLPTEGPRVSALHRALATARSTGRSAPVDARRSEAKCWVTPILAGAEHLGALVSSRSAALVDADLRALERAAQVMALLLLNERSVAEAEQRVRGDLLDDLLAVPQRDVEGLGRRASLLGADLDGQHVVIVARPVGHERRAVEAAAARLAAEAGGLSAVHGGSMVLLLPGDQPSEMTAAVARSLRAASSAPVTVGGAGPASGPAGLGDAHREAVRCHAVLSALGRDGEWATTVELGVYGLLLLGGAGREELERFLRSTLGPVIDYDAAHGTELERTLEAFLDSSSSVARAANALMVHVNTLRQRLDRVDQLLGAKWRQPEAALQLHLALRLRRITHPVGGT